MNRGIGRWVLPMVAVGSLFSARTAEPQGLTGSVIGTVRDSEGAVLAGAIVRISSASLIGGARTETTSETGQLRFLALPPGSYALDVEFSGMTPYHEAGLTIGAGATIERSPVLKLAGLVESVVVEGTGSRLDARNSGLSTRFGPDDLRSIPTRRSSMFDFFRATPGVAPTSPASGTATSISVFGSGTNENQFLLDGGNTTCPCNGAARAEPGVDFIQEIQVQSIGASAEFGNAQGGVFNVITRQGGERFQYDASYYAQTSGLTAQPVRIPYGERNTGYERSTYRDFTTNAGGPVVRDRLWFFGGYQYLRDYDSQPGTDPAFPRAYEQDKVFAKLTWKLTPHMQLVQSIHQEYWVNPDTPTLVTPFEATRRRSATVPAINFGHLTHALSANTAWDAQVSRFLYTEDRDPSTGDMTIPSRFDNETKVTTGAPAQVGALTLKRTTAKATMSHYRPRLLGAGHELKFGTEVEKGEQTGANVVPTGVRYVDRSGEPFQAIFSDPSNTGGSFLTAAAFATDGITMRDRVTISAGLRFDWSRAISQDLHQLDAEGRPTSGMIQGLGTMYVWNVLTPRLGMTAKLTADGRSILRGSFGRFSQGVQTGEFSNFHPGVTSSRTYAFEKATGDYTRLTRVLDPRVNLVLDSRIRPPYTDELSVGLDRDLGRGLTATLGYVHKSGKDFIAWTDTGGQYVEQTQALPDGRTLNVFARVNSSEDQRFLLTNPPGYSMTYNGLVATVERRWARGWQAFGSYSYSRTSGLQASSGATAAGPQSSTVAAPNVPFGRDPNDLTNASGRLPNDRPHVLRIMGTAEVPHTGINVAANLQHFSGKPWAASAVVSLPQNDLRILLEPLGSRRLSSQSLLDIRVSKPVRFDGGQEVEFFLDLLNALNDSAEEGLASDDLYSANFGQPSAFMDPRRAMIGMRLNLGH